MSGPVPVSGETEGRRRAQTTHAAPSAGALTFRAFNGAAGLAAIRADWEAVAARLTAPRFFHLFPWFDAYARTLEEAPDALRLYVAYAAGVPIAILPLALRTRKVGGVPLRVLEIPNDDHVTLCDFVFERSPENAGLVAAFVAFLRREANGWDLLDLPHLINDSAALFSVSSAPPPRVVIEPGLDCDYLRSTPFEEHLERFSKNFKGALRKARNKLAQQAGVEFRSVTDAAEIDAAFETFLEVEGSGWKGAAGTAVKSDPRVCDFYRRVITGFAARNAAEINLLRVGEKYIAAQFCLKVARCLYILKIGYDEQSGKLAPGNMLLENVMRRHAESRDVDAVNLITNASWHVDWKPLAYQRRNAVVFNASVRGLAGYVAEAHLRPFYRQHVKPHLRKREEAKGRRPPLAGDAGAGPPATEG